jgi:hypothetical protein
LLCCAAAVYTNKENKMKAVCPSCNSDRIALNMDVEVKAIYEDGSIDLNAIYHADRFGQLVCIDCDTVEDSRFHRGEWVMVAEINHDKEMAV